MKLNQNRIKSSPFWLEYFPKVFHFRGHSFKGDLLCPFLQDEKGKKKEEGKKRQAFQFKSPLFLQRFLQYRLFQSSFTVITGK